MLQGGILLPAALWLLTRRNPWTTLVGFGPALALAFGTSSSSAALGVTMQCARDLDCEDATVKFFLPLGTTCNMNGTALYEATTVLFIAQVCTLRTRMLYVLSPTTTGAWRVAWFC